MAFIWPAMLATLLFLPLMIWLYLRIEQRTKRLALRYSSFGLATGPVVNQPGRRRHVPMMLFFTGFAILLVSMARPQAVVNLPRVEGTIILAFDISNSMAATDIEPNRLEAAKTAARAFVASQPASVQIGVIAFSDSGFSIQIPTNDQELILAAISRLAPQRGTSLAQGIYAALTTIGIAAGKSPAAMEQLAELGTIARGDPPTGNAAQTLLPAGPFPGALMVLLTDGENNMSPDPFEAAQAAADRRVRIYTIGVGSPEGAILKIEGFSVQTRLDEATLQNIAQISGGAYSHATSAAELQTVYQNITPQLVIKPEKLEITSIFAGAGLLVLLVGAAFSFIWFSRLP